MGFPHTTTSSGGTSALSTLALGTTPAGNPTSVAIDANTQALHVAIAGKKVFAPAVFRQNIGATSLQVKATAGDVHGYDFKNQNTATVYIKFYNKVGPVNVATDVPLRVFAVPANSVSAHDVSETPEITCSTAIAVLAVTGLADTNAVAPATPIVSEVTYV